MQIEFSSVWDRYKSSVFAQDHLWSWYGKCRLNESLHIWR